MGSGALVTERLNYCTAAMSGMHISIDYGDRGGWSNEEERIAYLGIGQTAREVILLLNRAEKFILPEWGRIFTNDEWLIIDKNVDIPRRLPYPIVAVEYHCDYIKYPLNDPENELASSKRIALAVETEVLLSEEFQVLRQMTETNPCVEKEGYFILPIAYADDPDVWTPPPTAVFMPRSGKLTTAHVQKPGGTVIDYLVEHIVTLPLGKLTYTQYDQKIRVERMAKDLADEIIAIEHMQAALSLDKGRHTTLPAPERLNRKRAKKQKPPLYEYKVLDIVADVMHEPKENTHERTTGSHASPRLHTRRGHVRKLASGKTTWIRNAIVGKPGRGQVIKDYAVHD